jgi:hypothetical protein
MVEVRSSAPLTLIRLVRSGWIAAFVLLILVAGYPVSTRLTRALSVGLLVLTLAGLMVWLWPKRVARWISLSLLVLGFGFLLWPTRSVPEPAALRSDYVGSLRRYEGVRYVWGGENRVGVDCSGLVRRALVDSLVSRGVRTLNPNLVRRGLGLWWNDCSAAALGTEHEGVTVGVTNAASLNILNHEALLLGDLAVTRGGAHVLAYVGSNAWIEADPGVMRVVTEAAPSRSNAWFTMPMQIVRWRILQH